MKRVRQLVKRESAAEGWKHVGDEYAVSADRASLLASRGIVEILVDITVAEVRAEQADTAAPAKKTTARKRSSKKAGTK